MKSSEIRRNKIAVGSAGVAGFDGNGCSPKSLSLGPAGVIGGSLATTGVLGYTTSTTRAGGGWSPPGSICPTAP
jgi:hypothetical protein